MLWDVILYLPGSLCVFVRDGGRGDCLLRWWYFWGLGCVGVYHGWHGLVAGERLGEVVGGGVVWFGDGGGGDAGG